MTMHGATFDRLVPGALGDLCRVVRQDHDLVCGRTGGRDQSHRRHAPLSFGAYTLLGQLGHPQVIKTVGRDLIVSTSRGVCRGGVFPESGGGCTASSWLPECRDEGILHPVAVPFTFGTKPVVGIRLATRDHGSRHRAPTPNAVRTLEGTGHDTTRI